MYIIFGVVGMATAIAHYNYHDCILVNIEANFSVAYMVSYNLNLQT